MMSLTYFFMKDKIHILLSKIMQCNFFYPLEITKYIKAVENDKENTAQKNIEIDHGGLNTKISLGIKNSFSNPLSYPIFLEEKLSIIFTIIIIVHLHGLFIVFLTLVR